LKTGFGQQAKRGEDIVWKRVKARGQRWSVPRGRVVTATSGFVVAGIVGEASTIQGC
jgi:hypothetical protein